MRKQPKCFPFKGCFKVVILLFLPWNVLTAPQRHRLKRMDTSSGEDDNSKEVKTLKVSEEKELSNDDGENWYPVIEVGNDYYAPGDEPKNTSGTSSQPLQSNESAKNGHNDEGAEKGNNVDQAQPSAGDSSSKSESVSESSHENGNGTTNGSSLPKDEDWIKAIRELFMKWGYKYEEIPEPFGSKKTPDMEAPSPEIAMILKGLQESIPSDLKTPIANIIKADGVTDGNSSGNITKLEEIDETIKEIEVDLTSSKHTNDHTANHISPTSVDSGKTSGASDPEKASYVSGSEKTSDISHSPESTLASSSDNERKNDANNIKNPSKDHTKFCAEYEGPCPEEYDEDETEENNSEKDKLISDQQTIDTLIEDLKSIMGKPKEMTAEDSSKANDDLDKISTLIHEVESIAIKNVENTDHACGKGESSSGKEIAEQSKSAKSHQDGGESTKQESIKESSTVNPTPTATAQPKDESVEVEKHTEEAQTKESAMDSSNGNSILSRIVQHEREREASNSHEASQEEKKTIDELFNEIDQEGHKEREKDNNNPDLHKQVDTLHALLGHVHKIQSSIHEKADKPDSGKGKESHESASGNNEKGKEESSNADAFKGNNEIEKQENLQELKSMFNVEIEEVSKINEAHEKHKEEMLNVIRKLKITGKTDEDQERVKKIEQLVEDIDKEHHKALELQQKLNQVANGNETSMAESSDTSGNTLEGQDAFSNQMENLKKIEDNIRSDPTSSQYDTLIDETLHFKKIQSKGSKKHHDKDKSNETHEHITAGEHNGDAEKKQSVPEHGDTGHGDDTQDNVSANGEDIDHSGKSVPPESYPSQHNGDHTETNKHPPDIHDNDANSFPSHESAPVAPDQSTSLEGPSENDGDTHDKENNSNLEKQHAGQTQAKVQKGYVHQEFGKIALEPGEVNFNGAGMLHKPIDELKPQYPKGDWEDSNVFWPGEEEQSGQKELSASSPKGTGDFSDQDNHNSQTDEGNHSATDSESQNDTKEEGMKDQASYQTDSDSNQPSSHVEEKHEVHQPDKDASDSDHTLPETDQKSSSSDASQGNDHAGQLNSKNDQTSNSDTDTQGESPLHKKQKDHKNHLKTDSGSEMTDGQLDKDSHGGEKHSENTGSSDSNLDHENGTGQGDSQHHLDNGNIDHNSKSQESASNDIDDAEIKPIDHNDLNSGDHDDGKGKTETKTDSDETVDIINLEEELKHIDDIGRADAVIETLDKDPASSRFPDFSPEQLEAIIRKQHDSAGSQHDKKDSTHHHVEEHKLPGSDANDKFRLLRKILKRAKKKRRERQRRSNLKY